MLRLDCDVITHGQNMHSSRPHVLCVGDDRETAGLIAEELAGRGFRVSTAFDGGREAVGAILTRQPDIALVDVTMPVTSGFERLVADACHGQGRRRSVDRAVTAAMRRLEIPGLQEAAARRIDAGFRGATTNAHGG